LADDKAGWDALVRRRGPRLYAHALRLADSQDAAQDIVQDAWTEILRGPVAFLPWALRIVTRRAAGALAGQMSRRGLSRDFAAALVIGKQAEPAIPGPDPALAAPLPPSPGNKLRLLRCFTLKTCAMRTASRLTHASR
jgi:RNA polymerase sigma-70 factor (ECF subfamily)